MAEQNAAAPRTNTMNKAGWAVGTTTTISFTANPLLFKVLGRDGSKATVTNGATPTLDANTGVAFLPVPVSKCCYFRLGYSLAGTLSVVQGSIESLDATNAPITLPTFPEFAASICPAGAIFVKVGSTGAAWTFGVSNLAGPPTGVVFVIVDGDFIDRPFTA